MVTTLGAVAALRGRRPARSPPCAATERASVLFAKAREHYVRGEIRFPAEDAVYRHYVPIVRDGLADRAQAYRDRALAMSLDEVLDYCLGN
jgi:hypothetical protein